METLILNIFYLILLISILVGWIKRYRKSTQKHVVIFSRDSLLFIVLIVIALGPYLILNSDLLKTSIGKGIDNLWTWILSGMMSLLISGIWFMYVRKLDIFMKEKWKYLFLTFFLGSAFSFAAPYGYQLLAEWGFDLNGAPINDLLYSVFAIGGLEETVKIIPVFIILFFTEAIDEPFDYILYCSISALGFAFVENWFYIYNSGLFNIGGRALYATVAHMFDSSIIGYGLLLTHFRYNKRNSILIFLIFFFFAMISHGFYDFWLINNYVNQFTILTVLFYLISIHIWFIFKNNALNISNYYTETIRLDNDQLKSYLLISLASLMILGYILVTFAYGTAAGDHYLLGSWIAYGYLILYLAFSFSRYQVIKGQLSRFRIPLDFFIPKPIKKEKN